MPLRGSTVKIYTDPGSHLQGANKVIRNMIDSLDENKLKEFGPERGFEWHFTTAVNYINYTESIIPACKKSIKNAIGNQALTMIELLTVFYECANL